MRNDRAQLLHLLAGGLSIIRTVAVLPHAHRQRIDCMRATNPPLGGALNVVPRRWIRNAQLASKRCRTCQSKLPPRFCINGVLWCAHNAVIFNNSLLSRIDNPFVRDKLFAIPDKVLVVNIDNPLGYDRRSVITYHFGGA
jgi:hypothetical protein